MSGNTIDHWRQSLELVTVIKTTLNLYSKSKVGIKLPLCLTKYHVMKINSVLNYTPHQEDIRGLKV
jgi:hypothetical protein